MAAMIKQADGRRDGGGGMPSAAMAMLEQPDSGRRRRWQRPAVPMAQPGGDAPGRRRTTGEANDGAPRTDVASVRAVLGMCQGMQFPKPPGRNIEDAATSGR